MSTVKLGAIPYMIAFALAVLGVVYAPEALAQFTAPASQGIANIVGSSTSGSETGVYEVLPLFQAVIPVLILIALAILALMKGKQIIGMFRKR